MFQFIAKFKRMFTTSIQSNCAVFDTGRTCDMAKTAVTRVQSHDSLYEIYEGIMALGKIFLRGFWYCPVSVLYHKCFILVYIHRRLYTASPKTLILYFSV